MEAGDLREQITLQAHDGTTETWADIPTDPVVWAQVEAIGDERYYFHIRSRRDLYGFRDSQWAMRVLYRNRTLEIEDIAEQPVAPATLGLTRITAKGIHILVPDLGSSARQTLHPWPTP